MDNMKAGRFLRWHRARRKIEAIVNSLNAGNTIVISTHTKHIKYTAKHADMFRATKTGAYVQNGKNWLCIDGAKITAHTER